ncbi:hypothetical protein PF005_g2240 [Phytophthora fragariae]|uniref:DUF6818 domain-containing protein n=1 Tax=Phytophthora fragariae TaxID=53985 RepID=A0A6A3ZEX4_9STRA|nr:hypothetical protein PF007_g1404 [Phytophthora fragariae]KAE9233647.1 hypothetical protein PF005_g2240 [Phytophthora fragariae]
MKLEDREGLSSSPDLIIISDTSDDEEDKPAPPKEVLGKRERPHDSDAPPRASSDGCPPCKRRLTEPFEQADAQPLPQPPIHAHTAVPPPKNRQPAPARLNYVIREVKVWRESASKPRAHEPPRTPPDAKATICSSPLSTLKQVVRASTPKVAFSPAKWPGRVAYLHENYNSKAIKLPYVYHFGDCGCGDPCKIESCRNARMNIFCTDKCCCWEELCANRPRESDKLEVMQHDNTMQSSRMGKLAGSMNYSMPEIMHMLTIVKKVMPQGKDMWDAVAARYDATKYGHWPEREMESLRRKFKALYGLHKPTGCADMPAHVALAKDVKKLIDEASSVFVTSEDEAEERRRPVAAAKLRVLRLGNRAHLYHQPHLDCSPDDPDGYDSTGTLPPFMPSSDDGPDSTFDLDEEEAALAAAASTVTSPATTKSSTLSTSKTVSRAAAKVANARASNGSSKTKKAKPSAVQVATSAKAIGATTADSRERLRYPSLADCSDRLGGVNLADMRDSLKKRTYAEFEEASYTKQKRLKAEKAAAELKRKLDTATESASGTGGDLVKTIMVLRADAERADADRAKAAEALRREERREEREYLEARRQEERRADCEAQEERRREDCKEARQHMQDMLLMLSALKNGTIPNVCL